MSEQQEELDIRVILSPKDSMRFLRLKEYYEEIFNTEAFRTILRKHYAIVFNEQGGIPDEKGFMGEGATITEPLAEATG